MCVCVCGGGRRAEALDKMGDRQEKKGWETGFQDGRSWEF